MNEYIREFEHVPVYTHIVQTVEEYNCLIEINKAAENFSIFNKNIRSISKNFDELNVYIKQLKFDFDVIILTETWKVNDTNLYKINGYDLIYSEGNINQNDGVYIKKDISIRIVYYI